MARKRSKKQGAPPGTLMYIGDDNNPPTSITLVDYSKTTFIEKKDATLAECLIKIDHPAITWINIAGKGDPKIVQTLGTRFNWNPLMMEDILNTGQRPKCEDFKTYLFMVLRQFTKTDEIRIDDDQFSLILGSNYVITFTELHDEILDPVRNRIRRDGSRMREKGADYLAYAIIDSIVDSTFSVLEQIDEDIESVETDLSEKPEPKTLVKIQRFKREIAVLRKNLWPMREALSGFERKDHVLISDETRFFLRDVHDHIVLMIETIEGFRDILSGMLDLYLSNISLKMNEIMKVLTIVSTIFVPLTFIASIYGMNFQHMPELQSEYAYPLVLLLMLSVALFMLSFFYRKKWL